LSPNGEGVLAVASYFSGEVNLLDSTTLALTKRIPVGKQPPETAARAGERLFFDAGQCFQGWLSCASCHPEGRADGLNWDLLNDGMGNPKNTKSLAIAHRTPPVMSTGVRESMEVAVKTGFTFIQFIALDDTKLDQVRAYIQAMPLEGSPYLAMTPGKKLACAVCHHQGTKGHMPKTHMPTDGELSAEAQKGLKLFTKPAVGCVKCHPGPLFTDLKTYDVGSGHELDGRKDFDNPTCFELWRTAPYLHDGSAVSLMDMLTTLNKDNKHGNTSQLSDDDRKALVAYLLSL
jgi:cytochrome c peroxidase